MIHVKWFLWALVNFCSLFILDLLVWTKSWVELGQVLAVPGLIPTDRCIKGVWSREFAFLSSSLMLLLSSKGILAKIFLNLRDKGGKKGRIPVLFVPLNPRDCGCVWLGTLRCVRVTIKPWSTFEHTVVPKGGTGQSPGPFPQPVPGCAQGVTKPLLWLPGRFQQPQVTCTVPNHNDRMSFLSTCQNNFQARGFVWVYRQLIVPAEDLLNPAMTAVLSPSHKLLSCC